jgi:hypothetical protein
VSLHKGRKSGFVLMVDEAPKNLPIGQPGPFPQKHRPAKVLDDPAHLTCCHDPLFANAASALYKSISHTRAI